MKRGGINGIFVILCPIRTILYIIPWLSFVLIASIPAGYLRAQEHLPEQIMSYELPAGHVRDTTDIIDLMRRSRMHRQFRPDSSELLLRLALEQSRRFAWSYGAMSSLVELGNLYQDHGDYQKAVNCFNLALAFARTGSYLASFSTIYNNIGNAYSSMGLYEQAVGAMYYAVNYAEKFSSSMSVSTIYANLAARLHPEEAMYYLDKAEAILRRDSNELALGQFFVNKAYTLYSMKGLKSGISKEYFEKALRIGEEQKSPVLQHSALLNLGGFYLNTGETAKAMDLLHRAMAFHDDGRISETYKQHVITLYAGALYQEQKYYKAEALLLELLKNGKGADPATMYDVHKVLASIYTETGRYQLALQHKDALIEINDSLASQENSRTVRQLEIKYRTAQKDKELTEKQLLIIKQKRNLETKNFWIAGIAAGAAILILLLIVAYRNYKHKQTVQETRIRILQQEQEIGHLKAMMKGEEKERVRIARELHDGIGGMLTAVKMNLGTARNQFPQLESVPVIDDVMKMLEDTNEEVRKTAHNLMPDVLIKHGLEEALMIYCAHINAGSALRIDLQFHGELYKLDKGVELFLYRISQELIQNVVKHARADQAVVQIMQNANRISITVEDNGIGFDPNTESKGFGLQNLQYRIHALEGILSIMSAKGKSTTIYMEFEIEKLILANS